MSEFEKLKTTLNDKWLDYYEVNRSWLKKALKSNHNGDIDRRTFAYLILGVMAAIEPKLKEFLDPFCELNQQPLDLIHILGIDYVNLDQKLKERHEQSAQSNSSGTDELERIRQQLSKGEI